MHNVLWGDEGVGDAATVVFESVLDERHATEDVHEVRHTFVGFLEFKSVEPDVDLAGKEGNSDWGDVDLAGNYVTQ